MTKFAQKTIHMNEAALSAGKRASDTYLENLVSLEPKSHEDYSALTNKFQEAYVVISAVGEQKDREFLLEEWAGMQRFYANRIISELKSGSNVDGRIKELEGVIGSLESSKTRYEALIEDTKDKSPNKGRILGELAPKVEQYDSAVEEKKKLTLAKQRTDAAIADLTTLTKQTPNDIIHYAIIPTEIIIDNLKQNKYDPPLFSPIITTPSDISDIFLERRGVAVEEIAKPASVDFRARERPPLLDALLIIRDVISFYESGHEFSSSPLAQHAKVKEAGALVDPKDGLGAGKIGSYIERAPEPFGVRVIRKGDKDQIRRFVRLNSQKMSDESFLGSVIPTLQGSDMGQLNTFYIKKSLEHCREQSIGYGDNPVTIPYLIEHIKGMGFPITDRLGVNLGKGAKDKYGLEKIDDEGKPEYRFKEIIPTENQYKAIANAVKKRDHGKFAPSDILDQARNEFKNQSLNVLVIEATLGNHYQELGLEQIKGKTIAYRKTDRPQSAEVLRAGHEADPKKLF